MAGTGYKDIFETLRHEILDGKYDAEKTLPSEFGLARRFRVCRPTVSRAMQELVKAGLVVRRKGAPTTLTRFAQNASGYLALVIQGRWNESDLYPRVCRLLTERAERMGWKMIRFEIHATSRRGRLLEIKKIVERLSKERVTGVFFQPVACESETDCVNRDIAKRFIRAGIHVVLLDYDIVNFPMRSEYDLVGMDNFAAGYLLAAHFLERGLRRVSFLRTADAPPSVAAREYGIAAAVHDHARRWSRERNVIVCDPSDGGKLAACLRRSPADVVIAFNDAAALAFCDSLRRTGFDSTGLRVAGFDDIPAAAANGLPLTTVRQDASRLAEVAFHTLVTRIRTPGLPPRQVLLQGTLVVR